MLFLGVPLRKNFGSGFTLQSFWGRKSPKKDFHSNPSRKPVLKSQSIFIKKLQIKPTYKLWVQTSLMYF